jgi:hypothetical protein
MRNSDALYKKNAASPSDFHGKTALSIFNNDPHRRRENAGTFVPASIPYSPMVMVTVLVLCTQPTVAPRVWAT